MQLIRRLSVFFSFGLIALLGTNCVSLANEETTIYVVEGNIIASDVAPNEGISVGGGVYKIKQVLHIKVDRSNPDLDIESDTIKADFMTLTQIATSSSNQLFILEKRDDTFIVQEIAEIVNLACFETDSLIVEDFFDDDEAKVQGIGDQSSCYIYED